MWGPSEEGAVGNGSCDDNAGGKGKMLSAEASHSFTISALLTHSPGKVDSVFILICFPKCLEGEPNTYSVGKGRAALKASAI